MSSTGLIYKIYIPGLEEFCYVGSTTSSLTQRLSEHRYSAKNPPNGYHFASHCLFEEGNNPVIELLEEVEFETRQELLARERVWLEKFPEAINKNTPLLLSSEEKRERHNSTLLKCYYAKREQRMEAHRRWLEANKEQQAAYKKAKREANPELARQKDKEARERRKEKISAAKKERVTCPECGKEMARNSLWEHKKKIHSS